MIIGIIVHASLDPSLIDWSFASLDFKGLFRILVNYWNLSLKEVSMNVFQSSIQVDLELKELYILMRIMSVYGPYSDRHEFGESLTNLGVLNCPLFTLRLGLNFTKYLKEV